MRRKGALFSTKWAGNNYWMFFCRYLFHFALFNWLPPISTFRSPLNSPDSIQVDLFFLWECSSSPHKLPLPCYPEPFLALNLNRLGDAFHDPNINKYLVWKFKWKNCLIAGFPFTAADAVAVWPVETQLELKVAFDKTQAELPNDDRRFIFVTKNKRKKLLMIGWWSTEKYHFDLKLF